MRNSNDDDRSAKDPDDSRRPLGFRLKFKPRDVRHLPMVMIDGERWAVDIAGLVHYGRRWPIMQPPRPEGILIARRWLNEAVGVKTANWGSYGLKHCAEIWDRKYVSNGELICAACREEFSMRHERFGPSMNVVVGVDTRWLRTRPESRILGLWRPSRTMTREGVLA